MAYPDEYTIFNFISNCDESDIEEEIILIKSELLDQSRKIEILSKIIDKTKVKWKVFT